MSHAKTDALAYFIMLVTCPHTQKELPHDFKANIFIFLMVYLYLKGKPQRNCNMNPSGHIVHINTDILILEPKNILNILLPKANE